MAGLIEQRDRLRDEDQPVATVVLVRGGRDSIDKLRRHATRTARAWSWDGAPLFGISVFAVVDRPLDTLLRERFATFKTVHLTSGGRVRSAGFELLATGLRPHFTIRLRGVGGDEMTSLLAVLGPPRDNDQYGQSAMRREEV